uniref:DUF4019 domain-containing protein n=1 Tax=Schlesneria paludicola TaxID=360056 RepID=A0A7C2K1W9_9PLAN
MKLFSLMTLLVIGLCGCSAGSSRDGTEAAARMFFDAEFQKWITGQETQVSTMKSRIGNLKNPISYDIRSVVPDQPNMLAIAEDYNQHGESDDSDGEWAAWKFNVAIEWESQAGTPVEKLTTYTLTWNPRTRKWHVNEQH